MDHSQAPVVPLYAVTPAAEGKSHTPSRAAPSGAADERASHRRRREAGKERPAVTAPGKVRPDRTAAPAGKPVSVSCHRSAPVFDENPDTVSPAPTAATPPPTDA